MKLRTYFATLKLFVITRHYIRKVGKAMRIIAGEHKGQKIQPIPNQLTRPTGDKIKESLFQIIGPYFDGGVCLDLFAGSGALAIEALSRGVDKAILVD